MANKKQHTLGKAERLKSRKLIEQLFEQGKSFSVFPLRIIYMPINNDGIPLKTGFSVSTRYFKKAVDRNRIKRQMREAYRLQKLQLLHCLKNLQKSYALFFIYAGNEMPDYDTLFVKTKNGLNRIMKIANENNIADL